MSTYFQFLFLGLGNGGVFAALAVALVVTYRLIGSHSLGCGSRDGLAFKVDGKAPPDTQGSPKDYTKSGYDLGHLTPNQDFA